MESVTIGKRAIWTDPTGKQRTQPVRVKEWLSPTAAVIQLDKSGHCFAVNAADLKVA